MAFNSAVRGCSCARCVAYFRKGDPLAMARMFLCEFCGNKRCPHATAHWLGCTKSNDPDQPGSDYSGTPAPEAVDPEAGCPA